MAKYESHVLPRLEEIKAWSRDGLTMSDIAHNLGIATSCLYRYKSEKQEVKEALAWGRDYVDKVVVVNAYLRRVTGYDAVETKREFKITHDADGNEIRELVRVTEQTRHIPADPRACEFWLTNRQPLDWKYPQKIQPESDKDDGGGVIMIPQTADESDGANG